MDAAHLRLDGLTKGYGGTAVCEAVSLDVGREEFLTILGPSGSGKTTLLMMVAGFTAPDGGSIRLGGADITRLPSQKRDIGVVFQNYALFPHMTLFENLAYPLRVRRLPAALIRERVDWALGLMQLEGLQDRYPNQLSGGQQQRIAVARAVIFRPRLLLMDEPLGALDKKLRDYMQIELKSLQRRLQTAVLYVTHDQGEALAMSDRIAVMNRGRIEQIDTPKAIYQQPGTRFVAEFLGEAVLLEARITHTADRIGFACLEGGDTLSACLAVAVAPGQPVTLMVRPETIVYGGAHCENRVGGIIEEVVFLGDYTKCRLRISGNQSIFMKHPSHHPTDALRVGNRIEVGWRTHDTRIL